MPVDWLEMMQRLAAGSRAKVAEDRRRLEELQAQNVAELRPIPLDQMTDEQFEQHALSVLHRELGVYGLARFLRVYRAGTGDYTRDRHQWLKGLTVQELAQEFEGHQV